jgi:hypothetical protein
MSQTISLQDEAAKCREAAAALQFQWSTDGFTDCQQPDEYGLEAEQS